MGLFSSSREIYVSSSLYNMAGDEEDRPDYLKGTVFNSVMSDSPSLSDDITISYLKGPGIQQRQFFNWATRQDLAGFPDVTVLNRASADPDVVAGEITIPPTPVGLQISVQNSYVNSGDPGIFIRKWILENHRGREVEDYLGDYDPDTDLFSVTFPNGDFYSWANTEGYAAEKTYIVAAYFFYLPMDPEPEVIGTPVLDVNVQADVSGFDLISSTGTFTTVTLTRTADTLIEYSDATPDETSSASADVSADLNTSVDVYELTTVQDILGYQVESLFERYTYTGADAVVGGYNDVQVTVEDIGGGVTKTTTVTTTGEQVSVLWDEQYDTQVIFENTVTNNGEQVFIYETGTGNATLDALVANVDTTEFQEFFPFLPLRLKNKDLREEPYLSNGLYEETKKAFRRCTSWKNIDKTLDEIEDNPDVDDIDYAYVAFGCTLNVYEQSCRRYIYEFFKTLIDFQGVDSGNQMAWFNTHLATYESELATLNEWEAEAEAETNPGFSDYDNLELAPTFPSLTVPDTVSLRLRTSSPLMPSYDIRLEWIHIEEEQFTGVFQYLDPLGTLQDAKLDEVQMVHASSVTWDEITGMPVVSDGGTTWASSKDPQANQIDETYIFHQVSATEYRRLTIWGLVHYNYIYGGKSVKTTAKEALEDSDPSGFLVPLHYPSMRAAGIVDYTQMSTSNMHILFNSYEVVEQPWWQSWFFILLIIIAVLVISVILNPAAFAAGGGILGGNVAVGTALGLTGTGAIVAGVVANYLASIIISQVLSVFATEVFGERWGALFAALIGLAINFGMSGQSLFSAQGILGIANAVANGYQGWVSADIAEMQADLEEDRNQYETQMDYIDQLLADLGGNDLNFNPLRLTDSAYGNDSRRGTGSYLPETSDEFIRRTTMTGTDVVDLSFSMVYDFVDVQQTLPRN